MTIIPSIDIINGQCVRLLQGDYAKKTVYQATPKEMAKTFKENGASVLHVVDLEGAKNGEITQLNTIEEIVNAFQGIVQVGGGVREASDIENLLSMGVSRAVVGTRAIQHKAAEWLEQFGAEHIVLALDFKMIDSEPFVSMSGWTEDTTTTVWDLLNQYHSAKHVLCTDIGRDGMQQGPNMTFYGECVKRYPHINMQASGGVGSIDDVKTLSLLGVAGAIIGKAIYENKISLKEAIASC
jgi:phosphoribosylformimino-5-aminoimidazole carboxamide ribotide isomerase